MNRRDNGRMHRATLRACLVLAWRVLAAGALPAHADEPIKVGSRCFTESYVLGEVAHQTLQRAGVPAQHRQGLGNTAILEQALAIGQAAEAARLRPGLSHEFLVRAGGWPALKRHCALPIAEAPALDYGLAYQAPAKG